MPNQADSAIIARQSLLSHRSKRMGKDSRRAATVAANFQSSFIDFERGIRVGRLDPSQRITQIIKALLTARHASEMICDRWGRGVYWQWICWVPKPNREAKPLSAGYNFGSAKFFVSVDREDRIFQAGFQIERAPKSSGADSSGIRLQKDWDWHVLLKALRGKDLQHQIKRLLTEGFRVRIGAFSELHEYNRRTWSPEECRTVAQRFPADEWGGFQLFWPMPAADVKKMSGPELIEAVLSVFDEIAPAMNLCMYHPCLKEAPDTEDL